MKKCCFIIPYFGKLPNYFEVFVKSCSYNKSYDWLIFTDDETNYTLPSNVKIIKMKFEELKHHIQQKFNFSISLETPYKLCDYKPAYGYIFESYISEYLFWGHCDLDIIVGDMDNFITTEMLNQYDKLFCLGHLIMYKNNKENNRRFMHEINGERLYKKAFTTNEICVFDEFCEGSANINDIFLNEKRAVYMKDLSLNFDIGHTKFIKRTFNYKTHKFEDEKYKKALYLWNKGKLIRIYKHHKKLIEEEFLYAHFQQRKMKADKHIIDKTIFKIVPNRFLPLEVNFVTEKNFNRIRKKYICFHTIEMHIKWKLKKLRK